MAEALRSTVGILKVFDENGGNLFVPLIELINIAEKDNLSVRKLAEKFKIGKSQAAEILQKKEKFRKMWQSGDSLGQKLNRLKNVPQKIDKECLDWFSRIRSQNIPISGPLIKAKAKEIACRLKYEQFSASNGWLEKWRRHNISFKSISGESADVNPQDVSEFLQKLPSLLLGYRPQDIYNADESGLYFRALPDKTLALKSEKCVVWLEKKKSYWISVIGKAARPRTLKNCPIKDLPATWKSNSKAWMTREIMKEWLLDMDRRMRIQNRKILLFLDNAGSHPRDLNLENIKICFLPPNCTSVCQPLDQGIIKNVKFFYRDLILKHILTKVDGALSASELAKSINILEALYFVHRAWNNVSQATIKNCFAKAGFKKNESSLSASEEQYEQEDFLPLSLLASLIRNCKEVCSTVGPSEYVNIDEAISTEEQCNIDYELSEEREQDRQENDDEEIIITEISSIKSYSEALKVIEDLKIFARDDFVAFQKLKSVESHFQSCLLKEKQKTMKQSKIVDFFNS
ncbi:tigger transposable element-derived protein 6-like [Euwallacea fornicatus]|uniref:tigger transposable element-derived protein 6-like n=1 Tax=Euwallacea fornicatus TaxID=995702 RepID=UPI00338F8CA1